MINISPSGVRLAILEGAHAEEVRTHNRLMEELRVVTRQRQELIARVENSLEVRYAIEAEMRRIVSERKAA